jgi:hypothetical protein
MLPSLVLTHVIRLREIKSIAERKDFAPSYDDGRMSSGECPAQLLICTVCGKSVSTQDSQNPLLFHKWKFLLSLLQAFMFSCNKNVLEREKGMELPWEAAESVVHSDVHFDAHLDVQRP